MNAPAHFFFFLKSLVGHHSNYCSLFTFEGTDNVLHRITQIIDEHSPDLSEKHKELLKFVLEKGAKLESGNIVSFPYSYAFKF